jgi:hypothetical protein
VRFGPKPLLTAEVARKVKELRAEGLIVAEIIRRTKLSKASIYRALRLQTTDLLKEGGTARVESSQNDQLEDWSSSDRDVCLAM